MKLKKTIAGMLAVVTLMSSMAVSYAAGTKFSDVSEDAWYASAVNVVSSHGMVSGIGNNNFAPNMTMNRAMLVQILYNHAGKPSVSGDAAFTDVQSGSWYYDAVQWAAKNNVVAGVGNNKFDPEMAITREQFATILCNYYEKTTGESPAVDFTLLNNFGDSSDVSEWASISIRWAVTNKVMSGTDTGKLLPKQTATRAEAAQMLSNYLDLTGDTHKYELTNTVDPTETAEGKKEYTCSICNKVKTEVIPATGKKPDENCQHDYTEVVTKKATCTEDGIKTFTCSKCEGTYTEKIPAIGHDYESEVTLEPTETAPGIRKYFCNNCGHRYEEEIPPTGTANSAEHNWVANATGKIVDKEAYDEPVITGYRKYYLCHWCGARFYFDNYAESTDDTSPGQSLASDALHEHFDACPDMGNEGGPKYGQTTGLYSLQKEAIYGTPIHHDEVSHTGTTEYKCTKCGTVVDYKSFLGGNFDMTCKGGN